MYTFTKIKILLFTTFFLITLQTSPLLSQNQKYINFEDFDNKHRIGIIYGNVLLLPFQSSGFRNIEISDYEKNIFPAFREEAINSSYLNFEKLNTNKILKGVSIGFASLLADHWGGGVEFEFYGFENPYVTQYAAFINYSFGNAFYLIAPFLKFGYTFIEFPLSNISSVNQLELSKGPRNIVNLNNGDLLKTLSEGGYGQIGVQVLLRPRKDLGIFLQFAFNQFLEITQKTKLELRGSRRNSSTGVREGSTSGISFSDPAIVEVGTKTPALLAPRLLPGALALSIGIAYLFEY